MRWQNLENVTLWNSKLQTAKERLDDDIQAIIDTESKVDCGKAIGRDYSIVDLKEKYDAVLITIGFEVQIRS